MSQLRAICKLCLFIPHLLWGIFSTYVLFPILTQQQKNRRIEAWSSALATGAGTLYIERESRRDAMRVVHHMCEALQNGDILAVFPEGTTGNGIDLLPFHANLLQAAVVCNVPIQPVALTYLDPDSGQTSQAMSYIGDESLLESLWRTLKSKGVVAIVTYGEPQLSNDRSRRMWSDDLRVEIQRLRVD